MAAHIVPFHSAANTVASAPFPNFSSESTRFERSRPGNFEVEAGRDGRILSAIFDKSRDASVSCIIYDIMQC